MPIQLSQAEARTLLLAAQGLDRLPDHPVTKADVLATIQRMGALQIDTIHVVARSPYLVLWSRLGAYDPQWLDELLAEGKLFEYWSHAACFLPIEDYPLYRRRLLEKLGDAASSSAWLAAHAPEVAHVLTTIREKGPVRSADFERTDGQKGGWWNWKVEKQVLEHLHTTGQLMIARRQNFQRIYDLRERVLPNWDDAATPPLQEVRRAQVLKTVHALGVTPTRWVADYFRTQRRVTEPLLEELAIEGALLRAQIAGWTEPAYVHPDQIPLVEAVTSGAVRPNLTTLLSPFDPITWDRSRALTLFGFDYRIECYTPGPKRQYGYFTLPILHHDQLIGRLDAKAHRAQGRFEVKALHLEPAVIITDALVTELAGALRACATWHKTPEVEITWTNRPEFAAQLSASL
ncbi:MAG: winged helix DNA-binding domain-containing protein [Chloroflexi bacterium]|nr:winged helix DNA-binding domain-containing protein [Chloroflexota bacterium]